MECHWLLAVRLLGSGWPLVAQLGSEEQVAPELAVEEVALEAAAWDPMASAQHLAEIAYAAIPVTS